MSSSSDEFTHKQENAKKRSSFGFWGPYLCSSKELDVPSFVLLCGSRPFNDSSKTLSLFAMDC